MSHQNLTKGSAQCNFSVRLRSLHVSMVAIMHAAEAPAFCWLQWHHQQKHLLEVFVASIGAVRRVASFCLLAAFRLGLADTWKSSQQHTANKRANERATRECIIKGKKRIRRNFLSPHTQQRDVLLPGICLSQTKIRRAPLWIARAAGHLEFKLTRDMRKSCTVSWCRVKWARNICIQLLPFEIITADVLK